MDQTADIQHILQHHRSVAVVGLSPKATRDSYEVAEYMQQQGWRIIPVNPAAGVDKILGETVYASLGEAAQHEKIDLVDVFRKSEDVPPVAAEAIAIGAKGLWMQLDIEHAESAAVARQAGLLVVQNKCLLVEHRRLR